MDLRGGASRGQRPVCRSTVRGATLVFAALCALASCSSGATPSAVTSTPVATPPATGSSSTVSSTASTSGTPATMAGRTLTITVTGSTVDPAPAQIDLHVGETLTLVVTSDHDDELHAHGFEVETTLTAGKASTVALTGKEPGVFEVETHHPALTLLTVAVR